MRHKTFLEDGEAITRDGEVVRVNMIAMDARLDGKAYNRPHAAADQGDADRLREQARNDYVAELSERWRERDQLPDQRDKAPRKPDDMAPPDRAAPMRTPEEAERERTRGWEQYVSNLTERWRNPE
jgi:hypothetical protein